MTTRTAPLGAVSARPHAARTVLALLAAAVVAVAVNWVVATLTVAAGAEPGFAPLSLPVYGAFTVLGVGVGYLGWHAVERRAHHPRRVLAWLVPTIGVLSFAPDMALALLRYIPGTTGQGVFALMVMHVVVIAAAVPAYLIASGRGRVAP